MANGFWARGKKAVYRFLTRQCSLMQKREAEQRFLLENVFSKQNKCWRVKNQETAFFPRAQEPTKGLTQVVELVACRLRGTLGGLFEKFAACKL